MLLSFTCRFPSSYFLLLLSLAAFQNRSLTFPYTLQGLLKKLPWTFSMLSYFCYPPNYLLLHSVTRWPSSLQKFQFNPFTILLFTGTFTSFRLLSLSGNRSTNHSPPKMPTMTHPYKKASLPTPQNIAMIVHWLVSRLSSPMLDVVKVTELKLYQHGPFYRWTPGHLRPGVMWHPLTPQSILPWTLATDDYGLSHVTTIRKSPIEFMTAETVTKPSDLLRILPNHS